jgi:hypothetical protein
MSRVCLAGRHAPPRPAEVNSAGPHPTRLVASLLASEGGHWDRPIHETDATLGGLRPRRTGAT